MYLAIDIGTGSVRCALVDDFGTVLQKRVENIKTWNPKPDFYNQSSSNIWSKIIECCKSIKEADSENFFSVKGIAFDATCSLVIDQIESEQNVILWMDHRSKSQAERINQIGGSELRNVGGVISPEMETPD